MLVTALITPFEAGGVSPDLATWERLLAFQLEQGVDQVLLFGTTGEGAALTPTERTRLLDSALSVAPPERLMVSIGPGRIDEVIDRGRAALLRGVRDLLLVDCPYAGPSSASLRTAWHGPVASALPEARLIPYAVPSRTGSELLPDDLARLAADHPNVVGVKDATGRLGRMVRVRALCGDGFTVLSGDDAQLADAMLDPEIRAQGGISVASNASPGGMAELVRAGLAGKAERARVLHDRLAPLFGLVAVASDERLRLGDVVVEVPQRARNPQPLKAALERLGVPAGPCRPPHGELGERAMACVVELLASARPSLLAPLREWFAGSAGGATVRTAATSGGASEAGRCVPPEREHGAELVGGAS